MWRFLLLQIRWIPLPLSLINMWSVTDSSFLYAGTLAMCTQTWAVADETWGLGRLYALLLLCLSGFSWWLHLWSALWRAPAVCSWVATGKEKETLMFQGECRDDFKKQWSIQKYELHQKGRMNSCQWLCLGPLSPEAIVIPEGKI